MEVIIGENKYFVRWGHHQVANSPRRFTNCRIVNKAGEAIAIGTSTCGKRDNFCKDTGRKISLTRALAEAKFDRQQREWFWKMYFVRKNDYIPMEVSSGSREQRG